MKLAHRKASESKFLEHIELDIPDSLKQFILNAGGSVIIEFDPNFNKEFYGNEWVIKDYDGYNE